MSFLRSAGLAALLAVPIVAHAEAWVVTFGPKVTVSPPYEGAGHDVIRPSATFNIRRADRPYRFTPPDGGNTLALVSGRYLDFGPMVRFRYARGNQGKLTGLDRIPFAAEPGVFLDLWPANWLRGRVEARRGVTGHSGWVGDAGVDLIYTGARWDFSVGPRYGWGDSHYLNTYFGVTQREANRSPRIDDAYEPGAGQRYLGVETAVGYHFTKRFSTVFDIGYHRLAAKAADSPVVRLAGSPDDVSASFGVNYIFGIGRRSR